MTMVKNIGPALSSSIFLIAFIIVVFCLHPKTPHLFQCGALGCWFIFLFCNEYFSVRVHCDCFVASMTSESPLLTSSYVFKIFEIIVFLDISVNYVKGKFNPSFCACFDFLNHYISSCATSFDSQCHSSCDVVCSCFHFGVCFGIAPLRWCKHTTNI